MVNIIHNFYLYNSINNKLLLVNCKLKLKAHTYMYNYM